MTDKDGPLASASPSTSAEASATEAAKENAEPEEPQAPFGNYWRIISFGTRTDHLLLLVAFVSAGASGVAMPLMNIVLGSLVGDFNGYFVPNSTVTEQQFRNSVNRNSLYILYLFIGKFILNYVSLFCFRSAGLRISAALRLSYLQALFRQPVAKLDLVSAGRVANTITSSSNTIQLSISDKLALFVQALALVISAYAIAFTYSWALTLVTSSALLFILLVYSFTTPLAIRAQQKVDKADEKHASIAAEIFSSIRTVFSLGAERPLSTKYFTWVDESRKSGLALAPLMGIQLAPIFFSMYACFALAFWFGLKLYYEGHIANVNSVIIVFFSVLIVVSILGNIVQPVMNITKAISASTAFFEMIDSDKVSSAGHRAPAVSSHEAIEFRDVTFSYPTRPNVKVLKNFNARLEKGKTTALVGPSGSGKSTVVGLCERWYNLGESIPEYRAPSSSRKESNEKSTGQTDTELVEQDGIRQVNSGEITCGAHNINSFDLKWWRSQIGLVLQEPFLFNDTIFNNVSFGLLGTEWEHEPDARKLELVKEACVEAFADEFIQGLPEGYSTLVGESGIKLSGGQRQRLAIARSIVRQPAILILDEATSSIDVRGEKIVQEALDRVSKSRTTLIIAHRLATIRKADHIIIVRDGNKVEEGTHEELLSHDDGLYSSLVRAQALEEETAPENNNAEPAERIELLRQVSTVGKEPSQKIHELDDSSTYKKRGFYRSVGLFLYEQRTHGFLYSLIVLAAMGCGASFSLQSWFFANLIEVFQFTGQRLLDSRDHWSLMFFILAIAMAFCYFTLGYAAGIISTHVGAAYRKDYFTNILLKPVPFFDGDSNSSGSLMSRLSNDPKQLQELLGLNGAFPLISIFNMLGCIIISFYFGWKLTLVVLFAAMPVLLVSQFLRIRNEYSFETMNAKVFADSSSFATEAIGAFRTVSSLTMEDTILSKYSAQLQQQIKASVKRASYAMIVNALCDSIELCAMALAFWYGGQLLATREYQPVEFFVIYVAIIQGAIAAGQFFSTAPNLVQATQGANRILSLRSTNTDSGTLGESHLLNDSALGAGIELDRVSFQYPSRETPAFLNLSVSIPAGSFAAFVGPSGCGKTTIISLLERFYNPVSGTISVNGTDIRMLDLPTYRRSLSLVSQEPRLFDGTIRENLLLGIDTSNSADADIITDEQIHQACRDAEIHDFVASLPEGYGTELGINTSTTLSGGQKQRLCLARALLRKPKLLLLDEATSSLDSQSEKLVQVAIERLAGQRSMTVVAVAHRLATIQKADVIFVFGDSEVGNGARILERGNHRELLRRRGAYWQMCQAQALDR